jgi:Protein of unknown function (DUF1553)/Protein of unknown function (DUF1549)
MEGRGLCAIAILAASFLSASGLETYKPAERRHWSFQKRAEPAIPQFTESADRAWAKQPIDAFILEKLGKQGLRPAPAADRATLIRRVYFDLTGLPPSPSEVRAFVNDPSPTAYVKVIDKLLATPAYAERWAQHWLDVVRFAETDGFEYDTHRRGAWRYRDYAVRSFHADKPYDEFIREQLAGDEIDSPNEELKIAAGFHRLGPLRKNAGNQEVASSRNEVLTEMTNAVGSALLGVTLGCARCHDHKFDPIRHTDYYRMQAFFAATHEKDIALASEQEQAEWKATNEAVQAEMKQLRAKMKDLKGEDLEAMKRKLEDTERRVPEPLPALFSVSNDSAKISPVHVLARGDYQNKGEKVGMRPLGVLLPDGEAEWQPEKPRTALANWLLHAEHPLTARVVVNRIWNYHFGRGIVATPNDFGRMGARPSHKELLDYLANRFVENGWRWKPLHREILLSNTYQQSSKSPIEALAKTKDANNELLWKFSRRRLEAEEIRDAALAVAGKLNPKQGGPSVIVPVDQELINLLYKPSQWAVTPDPEEHNRRSIYLIAKRNLRLPFMESFDAPDLNISCARRDSSTHAPQALELMNGDLANRLAVDLAKRLETEAGANRTEQVDLAYQLATGRAPTAKERQIALEFLKAQPLREFALAMFNLNAFLYVE